MGDPNTETDLSRGQTWTDSLAMPSDMLANARKRLGVVAVAFAILPAVFFPLSVLAAGFDTIVGAVVLATVVVSIAVYYVTRSQKFSDSAVLFVGLVFETLLCLSASTFASLETFEATGTAPELTFTAVIIVVFPLILAGPPRFTVVSSLVAASMAPLGLYVMHGAGVIDSPTWSELVAVSLGPGGSVALAYMGSKVLHGLGADLAKARKLGSYTLEELLGRGGMGEVWRAKHTMLSRPAAIKLIKQDPTGEGPGAVTGLQIARFEREVQLTTRLSHPNTITIFDYGRTYDGTFYYVMELLDGADLNTIVDVVGPQSPQRVRHILRQVLGSLEEAHGIGLIHRDIKPPNIVMCTRGGVPDVAKLLDFGLVKDVQSEGDVHLTGEGRISGTPLYMAPESIISPNEADARSDVYAVGAVAYFLLTGEHVFSAKTLVEICGHHLHTVPTTPSKRLGAELPEDLERLVMDCLAKDPADRPESASAMLARLDELDIPAWTRTEAAEWWQEYGAALVPEASESPAGRTIDVDVKHHAPPSKPGPA